MQARWYLIAIAALAFISVAVRGGAVLARQTPPPKAAVHASGPFPPVDEIRQMLAARVGDHPGLGVVVGLLDETGRRTIVTAGSAGEGRTRPLDGETVFEIGSISKVFTPALLAEMAERGEVSLDDPVAKYLPATVTVPSRGERQITLADLATAGYIDRQREGRRNFYTVRTNLPLGLPIQRDVDIGALVAILPGAEPGADHGKPGK